MQENCRHNGAASKILSQRKGNRKKGTFLLPSTKSQCPHIYVDNGPNQMEQTFSSFPWTIRLSRAWKSLLKVIPVSMTSLRMKGKLQKGTSSRMDAKFKDHEIHINGWKDANSSCARG